MRSQRRKGAQIPEAFDWPGQEEYRAYVKEAALRGFFPGFDVYITGPLVDRPEGPYNFPFLEIEGVGVVAAEKVRVTRPGNPVEVHYSKAEDGAMRLEIRHCLNTSNRQIQEMLPALTILRRYHQEFKGGRPPKKGRDYDPLFERWKSADAEARRRLEEEWLNKHVRRPEGTMGEHDKERYKKALREERDRLRKAMKYRETRTKTRK